MDLELTPREDAFRAEARAWLEAHAPKCPPSGDTASGFAELRAWERALFDARWAVVSWPSRYGGRDATLNEWLIFEEEYYRAGAPPRITQNGIFLLAPTLFEFGTEEQKDRVLPRMASAETTWAQGWSEPEAGSDLAGIRCRAERDDEVARVLASRASIFPEGHALLIPGPIEPEALASPERQECQATARCRPLRESQTQAAPSLTARCPAASASCLPTACLTRRNHASCVLARCQRLRPARAAASVGREH